MKKCKACSASLDIWGSEHICSGCMDDLSTLILEIFTQLLGEK